jgi:hypothetical protein
MSASDFQVVVTGGSVKAAHASDQETLKWQEVKNWGKDMETKVRLQFEMGGGGARANS